VCALGVDHGQLLAFFILAGSAQGVETDLPAPTLISPSPGAFLGIRQPIELVSTTVAEPATTVFVELSAYPYTESSGPFPGSFAGAHVTSLSSEWGSPPSTRITKLSYSPVYTAFMGESGTIYWHAFLIDVCSQPFPHACHAISPTSTFTYGIPASSQPAPSGGHPAPSGVTSACRSARETQGTARARFRRAKNATKVGHSPAVNRRLQRRVRETAAALRRAEQRVRSVCP
jgi:hypothetical protein